MIGQRCYYGSHVSYLQVLVSPRNDRPIVEARLVMFSPIPHILDATYQRGVSVSILMATEQCEVRKLLEQGKSNTVRKQMAGNQIYRNR